MSKVDEKFNYYKQFVGSKKYDGQYASGYCVGVTFYRDFKTESPAGKRNTQEFFDNCNRSARQGDKFSRGVMSALRDSANERKGKYRG